MTADLSLTFPSGILHFPQIAPPGLILNHLSTIHIHKHSNNELWYKKPYLASGNWHSTSTRVLSGKHSTTNEFSTMIGSRWYTKGRMHSRVSFNSYDINAQVNNNFKDSCKAKTLKGVVCTSACLCLGTMLDFTMLHEVVPQSSWLDSSCSMS
jgi:hypothetical protein